MATCRSSQRCFTALQARMPSVTCTAAKPRHQNGQVEVASSSRRDLLGAAVVMASFSTDHTSEAAAAAAPECVLQSTPSGLQFCELQEGTGPSPVKGALIRCHYSGQLASNGKVFDSSYQRGRPLTFKIGAREVIAGWDLGILGGEGIPPMKEGGKRQLVIPADLAYGERGAGGGLIPAGATLIFQVELLGKPGRR